MKKSNKLFSLFLSLLLVFSFLGETAAEAKTVYWGKMALAKGQVGKITILKPIKLWKRDANNKLVYVKGLLPKQEYRVYGYSKDYFGQYYVGGGHFITNMQGYIKYESIPKSLASELNGTVSSGDKAKPVNGQIGRVTILKPIKLWKRDPANKLVYVSGLTPGQKYPVYSYSKDFGGQYGVGGNYWITNMKGYISYEAFSQVKDNSDAEQAQKIYKQNKYDYKSKLAIYDNNGNYFNSTSIIYDPSSRKMDENGVIMARYGATYQYNPVTIAQYGLALYGRYNLTKDITYKNEFLRYADVLTSMQGKDGALRYNFPFTKDYLHVRYNSGWVSGMAQGQVLSVYARAYYLTQDQKYLEYGQKVFKFLNTPISRGGTLTTLETLDKKYSKGDYFWYEEYISSPNNYTLNGYMFALFGIYDWSKVQSPVDMGQKEADRMFNIGIKSLTAVLPLYDINGFTSYDLSGITMKQKAHIVPEYHAVHIFQLYGLYSITKNPEILKYYNLWSSYVN